jgi:hypothetical protein
MSTLERLPKILSAEELVPSFFESPSGSEIPKSRMVHDEVSILRVVTVDSSFSGQDEDGLNQGLNSHAVLDKVLDSTVGWSRISDFRVPGLRSHPNTVASYK